MFTGNYDIKEMKQSDLDALIMAYNDLDIRLSKVRDTCQKMFLNGLGVAMQDPRFHYRMAAHQIMTVMGREQVVHPIHDRGCHGVPCVCRDCVCRDGEQ